MNLKEIQQLVKLISGSNVDVLEIEEGDFHLKIKKNDVKHIAGSLHVPNVVHSAPIASVVDEPLSASSSGNAVADAEVASTSGVEIKSPMIGTFYRSSAPEKPVFVNVGDEIKVGQTLCIVEAMKLFNEIEAEVSGRIVKVLVDDATPVEYDQPLFLIEPI